MMFCVLNCLEVKRKHFNDCDDSTLLMCDDVDIIGDLKRGWRDVFALHTDEGLVAETFVYFPHW